ncbi:hypothetical protein BDW22DRAFT_238437 [Trametopsis cervina]|nr:hypothetical protein BDW22DRAFT_238437 [Trametopsis cervina]
MYVHISYSATPTHAHTRIAVNTIYELADGSYTAHGMSTRAYLAEAQQLRRHLTAHHTIEEQRIFPVLATRMPKFANADGAAHIASHHAIHEGLDALGKLLAKYAADPTTYTPAEMRACLDGWRGVLFKHLDEEVEDLSAANMKKYWKLHEVDRIPF